MKALVLAVLAVSGVGLSLLNKGTTVEVYFDGGYRTFTKAQIMAKLAQKDAGVADLRRILEREGVVLIDDSYDACACSSGSNCRVALDDGGLGVAPIGAAFKNTVGAGCLPTPCVEWLGKSSPFNPACACPLRVDGGRGC
jgi:hypothetical protein